LFVQAVTAGGPADHAGLRPGDVILKVDGEPAESVDTLIVKTLKLKAGADVRLTYERRGASHTTTLTLSAGWPRSMSFRARSAILQEIGTELQAGVLAYVTGDRENLETEVSADVLRRVPRHLEAGKQDRLALVLYTLGCDTNTPWPFVNIMRG
jgi:membrane-associated protease RseP (regulator of RpoE activity)